MNSLVADLWPDDIALPADFTAPVTILKAQAMNLAERTQNVISGEVQRRFEGDTIGNHFLIRAAFLDDFRQRLFTVRHGLCAYPATIENIYDHSRREPIECHNQEQFENEVKGILHSNAVREMISSLLAQSAE